MEETNDKYNYVVNLLKNLAQFFKDKMDNDKANASHAALSSITCHDSKTEEYRKNASEYIIKKGCWEDVTNELNRIIHRIEEERDVRN